MKYAGGPASAGTSAGAGGYEQSVIAAGTMSGAQFGTMDSAHQQNSVIKTAPPCRSNLTAAMHLMDFSPKQEPIDLAPLNNPCLQDLSKMSGNAQQLHQYYSSMNAASSNSGKYSSVSMTPTYYEYLNVGAAAAAAYPGAQSASSLLQPTSVSAVVALGGMQQQEHGQHQQDWPYVYSGHSHQSHQQQQQQLNYLGQLDACGATLGLEQQQRIYKSGGGDGTAGGALLSPVDSGIGTELSLLEHAKTLNDFFAPISLSSAAVLVPSQSQPSVIHHQHQQQCALGQDLQHQQRHHHHQQRGQSRNGAQAQEQMPHSHNQPSPTANLHRAHESREQSIPAVIPKLDNQAGFQYWLEAPISTSIRKDDDRMTYVNKSQFYTVTMEFFGDVQYQLKGPTVRSRIMVVFREDKSYDEELRTWLIWFKRQHSTKQRIIEVDLKNSTGAIGGHFNEIAHNAVEFCWNWSEPAPKVSIAVQCLSTDFSTQKGVKGLPLHIQIDTYDDHADSKIPFHRGYCQIKVFCDKGAERKLRDEDKRAHRRKNNTGGAGSSGPSPSAPSSCSSAPPLQQQPPPQSSGGGRKKLEGEFHGPCERSHFYHSADLERPAALFVPSEDFFDTVSVGSYDALSELEPQPKRPRPSERIMIYVRKADEDVFTALHLIPPTLSGLARAISEKYNVDESKIESFYKHCLKGRITVKIDDDMLRHYSNQDSFLLEMKQDESDRHIYYTVTLIELSTANSQLGEHSSQTPSATSASSTASEPCLNATSMAVTNGQQQHQQRGIGGW